MRILTVGNMYPPHHLGGYELMWRSSVEHLRRNANEVRVVTTGYRNPALDLDVTPDEGVARDLRWYWRDHEWPRLGIAERRRLERHNLDVLERQLEEFKPEAVAWWAMGGMSMALIERVRQLGLPAVGVVVDDWLLYGPGEDQWQRSWRRLGPLRALVTRFFGVPTGLSFDDEIEWVVVSEATRGRARAGGWRLTRSAIAHAGIDSGLFRERPELPWRGELLYLGRIDARKGVQTAISAVAMLDDVHLNVIGGGDQAHLGELEALVAELGLGERVGFGRVPRERIADAYAQADALLFPVTWAEPFGLVPLEAMAVGTPVIATGTGGSGEYLKDGENCLLFERGDTRGLASAIERLQADGELRRRLREGGLATAAGRDEASFNEVVEAALHRAVARAPATQPVA